MTKGGKKPDNNDNAHKDLTRLEDLSEFLHVDDSKVDLQFNDFKSSVEKKPTEEFHNSTSIEDEITFGEPEATEAETETEESLFADNNEEVAQEFLEENPIDSLEESLKDTFNFDSIENAETDLIDDAPFELSSESEELSAEETTDISKEMGNFYDEDTTDTQYAESEDNEPEIEAPRVVAEKFDEVASFAQNFSYGQIAGGGNPPFSIIVRNIKYSEDAEDIIIMLREFKIVTDQNLEETQKSLEFGSLLIPQISEYSAIVLAHRLRRYDCDLEVGLSDEVHPSKSGESNPRGLMKKNSIRQNKEESYKLHDRIFSIDDILVATTSSLEGHSVLKYVGAHTSFAIVDEEELERLKFVQEKSRNNNTLYNYDTEDDSLNTQAFKSYQNSFNLIFIDLCDQLKAQAMKENANALLGLNYQLSSMPFEKSAQGKSCYQITCSATLAVVVAQ